MRDFYPDEDQWMFHFDAKGGKSREIPCRHDLQRLIQTYIELAGLQEAERNEFIFRAAVRREKRFSENRYETNDICRMIKRRLKQAGLPSHLSAHSFRVTTITDLLKQGRGPRRCSALGGAC